MERIEIPPEPEYTPSKWVERMSLEHRREHDDTRAEDIEEVKTKILQIISGSLDSDGRLTVDKLDYLASRFARGLRNNFEAGFGYGVDCGEAEERRRTALEPEREYARVFMHNTIRLGHESG